MVDNGGGRLLMTYAIASFAHDKRGVESILINDQNLIITFSDQLIYVMLSLKKSS